MLYNVDVHNTTGVESESTKEVGHYDNSCEKDQLDADIEIMKPRLRYKCEFYDIANLWFDLIYNNIFKKRTMGQAG